MNAVLAARQRGWRYTYANRLTLGFWGVHLGAVVGVAALGWSWSGLALALALYGVRMFFVTGAYHRYFSHRSFRTSRAFQLVLAVGAQATFQKGALWWAAHHRLHHKASDQPDDLHSPVQNGFWWSHLGWILTRDFEGTDLGRVKDLARYPELVWLNRWWMIPPFATAALLYLTGGLFGLVWGFAVSQVLTWHGTFTINSLSHVWGARPYRTDDDSRNNALLGLVTLGEGWHNNHHHYQVSARQGFRWWQIDITYYVLQLLSAVGLVWDLHGVPRHVLDQAGEARSPAQRSAPAKPATSFSAASLGGTAALAVAAAAATPSTPMDSSATADHGIVASCGSLPPTSNSGVPSSS